MAGLSNEQRKTIVKAAQTWTFMEKMATMKILESNEGNISETSRQLGIARTTMLKWKNKYWDEYLERRKEVEGNMITVEAKKLTMFNGTSESVSKITELAKKTLDHFIDNPENIEELTGRDKVQLLNVLIPYLVEKKTAMGAKEQRPSETNNFYTNILQQLKDNNDGNNQNQISGDKQERPLP